MAEPPLGSLGWAGRFGQHHPEVAALRQTLLAEAGMRESLEFASDSAEAARLFHRDGFCLIRDCLSDSQVETLRSGCDAVVRRIVEHDPHRSGNRDSHRFSFAGAAVEFGETAAWQQVHRIYP